MSSLSKVSARKQYQLPSLPSLESYALLSQHDNILANQSHIQEPLNYKQASVDPI